MSYIAAEDVAKAKEMDLLTYLCNYEPQELVHVSGNTYCTREHDSLRISNGKWCWFSQGIGGRSALDYLIKVKGIPFTQAAEIILGREAEKPPVFYRQKERRRTELLMPELSETTDRVEKYLYGRGIHPVIIRYCVENKLIFESANYHNAVFVGHDKYGKARYGALRSTVSSYKGELAGSDKHFSFPLEGKPNPECFQGSAALRSEIYDKVFEGEAECGTMEEVYQMFNLDHPDGYQGRYLSVSDVVEVVGEEKSTFHFCDSIGFREVDFDPDRTEPLKEKKIKVVLCEPGKVARVAEIGTELSDLQRVVGGLIEPYYPFEEQVCIVCNDEGKYNGMRPCRAIYGEGREMMDIIFGPFFICDCSTPNFGSLNKEQLERYKKQFQNPEHFFRVGGEIKAVPYKPEKDHER